jgi:hypothetical protein
MNPEKAYIHWPDRTTEGKSIPSKARQHTKAIISPGGMTPRVQSRPCKPMISLAFFIVSPGKISELFLGGPMYKQREIGYNGYIN